MGNISYRPLIEDMTWSYSRIGCFDDCPYRWYMKYIRGYKETPQFYSSYGSFMHKLIEKFYRGEITKDEMQIRFLLDFSQEVKGVRPQDKTVQKYIQAGVQYLKNFKPFPFNLIEVEKKIEFDIDGIPFVGYIDYLGEKDGNYYIIDNKSRDLKPRSNRRKPTVKDNELDEMLKQLYIYSVAIKQEYGNFPKSLCFNCFKSNTFIEEPFNYEAYLKAIEWVKKSVEKIKDENEFPPNREFFSCYYICGLNNECCYWQMR